MDQDEPRPDVAGSDEPAVPAEEASGGEAAGDGDPGPAETEAGRLDTTGDPDPWAGLGLGARVRARPRVVAVVSVVAVLVVVAAGVWVVRRVAGEPERTPRQTVRAFFQAQRDGDCRRLIDLLAEDSWSRGGERSRRQFMAQCADAVGDYDAAVYQPRIREPGARFRVEVVDDEGEPSPDGEAAVVTVADLALYEDDTGREGRLVREGGEWKVVTDAHILPIGRSVPETVRGYLDAYNAGDCERLLDHLSEPAWSEGGQLSREAFLEQCDAAAEARQAFMETPIDIAMMEVSGDDEGEQDDASAVVDLFGQGGSYTPPPSDSVTVVRDGLEWKLDIRETRRAEGITTPFVTLDLFELRARFVDEIATPEGPCTDTWDDIVWGNVDAAPATRRRFICDAFSPKVTLYRYPNDEEARAAADRFVAEALQEPLTTAEELARPDGLSLAEAEAYVATLRPNQATTVPGLPDALGVLRSCNVDGCRSADAFAIRNGVLVQVRDGPLTIDQAAAILEAQLAQL